MRILYACIVLITAAGIPSFASSGSPPSFVLVLVDDLRWDALSATGNPYAQTSHMDRLVQEGRNFDSAFVATSLCSPSRATILTGRYPGTITCGAGHNVMGNNQNLNPALPTWPKALQAAGYKTAFIGKWHMAATDDPQPGFDRWVSFYRQGTYIDPLLDVDGATVATTGHLTDILTNYALDFVDNHQAEPFALIVSYKAVHSPRIPPDRFVGALDDVTFQLPATWDLRDPLEPRYLALCRTSSADQILTMLKEYHETNLGVDDNLGRILAALDQYGIADETMVIFTSDNGYFWGEHGLIDKRAPFEESIRIPLVVRYPAWFAAGSMESAFALNVDFAATILEAAGVAALPGNDGVSLRTVDRTEFYHRYWGGGGQCVPPFEMLRTETHKFVPVTEELYDLQVDPLEIHNLYPTEAQLRQELQVRLEQARQPVCSSILPVCGDGIKNQPSEQCDSGDATACPGLCLPNCTCGVASICGNAMLEPGEECDDGNAADCDGCSADCENEGYCGDGRLDPNCEGCDGDYCCSSSCQVEPPPCPPPTDLGICSDGCTIISNPSVRRTVLRDRNKDEELDWWMTRMFVIIPEGEDLPDLESVVVEYELIQGDDPNQVQLYYVSVDPSTCVSPGCFDCGDDTYGQLKACRFRDPAGEGWYSVAIARRRSSTREYRLTFKGPDTALLTPALLGEVRHVRQNVKMGGLCFTRLLDCGPNAKKTRYVCKEAYCGDGEFDRDEQCGFDPGSPTECRGLKVCDTCKCVYE